MNITTQSGNYWRSAANTNGSFATKIDTLTKPSGTNVLDLSNGLDLATVVDNNLLIHPFGIGADNDTFDFRVWGWATIFDKSLNEAKRKLWHPILLAGFSVTLNSSQPGIVGAPVINTEYYADTITLRATEGTANVSNEIVSAPGVSAYVVLDARGFYLIEFEFDMTGTSTSGSVLVKSF